MQELQSETTTDPPSYEDSELEARFSKLGLDLPSTPSTAPSAKAKNVSKAGLDRLNQSKAKSTLLKFTDEEIDSWCCICNEGRRSQMSWLRMEISTAKIVGVEGHGNGPGQERGHKAVQYNKEGPAAAAA